VAKITSKRGPNKGRYWGDVVKLTKSKIPLVDDKQYSLFIVERYSYEEKSLSV